MTSIPFHLYPRKYCKQNMTYYTFLCRSFNLVALWSAGITHTFSFILRCCFLSFLLKINTNLLHEIWETKHNLGRIRTDTGKSLNEISHMQIVLYVKHGTKRISITIVSVCNSCQAKTDIMCVTFPFDR